MDPRRVWEAIAEEFDATRDRPWPAVLDWARANAPAKGRVLDLGAGNARHAAALSRLGYDATASDFARPFAQMAHARGVPGVLADNARLPFQPGSFDAVLFVASLHNMPERDARTAALREVARVLRPKGRALVTVWRREGVQGDAEIFWRGRVARYYRFYAPEELAADARAAGLDVERVEAVAVGESGEDNWFLHASKRQPFEGRGD